MTAKDVSESAVVMTHAPMADEANNDGNMHGGHLLKHIDTAAGVVGRRHARSRVVTASLERMDFLAPVHLKNLVILKASINKVGKTSMDIGVRVETENLDTGEIRHAATCYLTIVALGADGNPQAVPPLKISTEQEKARLKKAEERLAYRKSLRK